MKKDNKQRLFEVMQRVVPDFKNEGIPMMMNPEDVKIKAERVKAAIDELADSEDEYGVLETLFRLLVEKKKPKLNTPD